MNRRHFLVVSGVSCLALAACGLGDDYDPDKVDRGPAKGRLEHFAVGLVGVGGLGRSWIDAHPDENYLEQLLLDMQLDPDFVIEDSQLSRLLNDLVEKELEQGVRFEYGGWWLAPSEARLAALHVLLLGQGSNDVAPTTFEDAVNAHILEIQDFAPRQMTLGGDLVHSTLPDRVFWFKAPSVRANLRVIFAGSILTPTFYDHGFAVRVPDAIVNEIATVPGDVEIWLWDPSRHARQQIGVLSVVPEFEEGQCPVMNTWGPKFTRAGESFNQQPDGSSALWVTAEAIPPNAVLLFDGIELPTRTGDKVITASVPDLALYEEPGSYTLELLDVRSGSRCFIGVFSVASD